VTHQEKQKRRTEPRKPPEQKKDAIRGATPRGSQIGEQGKIVQSNPGPDVNRGQKRNRGGGTQRSINGQEGVTVEGKGRGQNAMQTFGKNPIQGKTGG